MEDIEANASTDQVFSALSNQRRRWLLRTAPTETAIQLDELAERYVEHSPDAEPGDLRRVVLSFRHVHLPKLDDARLVDYDRETGTITRREGSADRLSRAIDEIRRIRRRHEGDHGR